MSITSSPTLTPTPTPVAAAAAAAAAEPTVVTLFTSESVTSGNPDKVADTISDALLDEAIRRDPEARVAIETLVKGDRVIIAGEIRLAGGVGAFPAEDRARVVRQTLRELGYDGDASESFRADLVRIEDLIGEQSREIAAGVDAARDAAEAATGAGDQGLMFGYATDETPERMPLAVLLAHRLTRGLEDARRSGEAAWLRPDGKAQVTVRLEGGRLVAVHTVVVSTQHAPEQPLEAVRQWIAEVLVPRCLGERFDPANPPIILANPAGSFTVGGPEADAGVTGRKIIVDTYGGAARHGGGAFSVKDATKVDRTAAYYARFVARAIVDAGLARRAEIQVAYAIGRARPVSIAVETFGTGDAAAAERFVTEEGRFDFTPAGMIEQLGLRTPCFRNTTNHGHFGRPGLAWERPHQPF